MGEVIRFPLERRRPPQPKPELVEEPGWFGVRLRPQAPYVVYGENKGAGLNVTITNWLGQPIDQ